MSASTSRIGKVVNGEIHVDRKCIELPNIASGACDGLVAYIAHDGYVCFTEDPDSMR